METRVMKAAQVLFVNSKGFGFLDCATGRVFFHKSGYGEPRIVMPPLPHIDLFKVDVSVPRPKVGDWVVYHEGTNDKGVIADEWCYRRDWNKLQQQIKELPRYRVVYRHGERQQAEADPQTRSWTEKVIIRETIYEPTYLLDMVYSLLDYKGNQMLRSGEFQLQIAKTGDNWEVATTEIINKAYHRYFAVNSLWNYQPDQELTRKVA